MENTRQKLLDLKISLSRQIISLRWKRATAFNNNNLEEVVRINKKINNLRDQVDEINDELNNHRKTWI